MALPPAILTRTVRVRVAEQDGTPATGRAVLSMPHPLYDGSDLCIVGAGTYSVELDAAGVALLDVPANNIAGVSPSGWLYTVKLSTSALRATYSVAVPTGDSVLDLSTTAPAVPGPVVVTYLLGSAAGAPGGVATLDAEGLVPVEQLPAGSGGGIASVNGDTGPVVVLDAADVGAATPAAVTAAVTAHTVASDPHGDRAAASAALTAHETDTTGVHGIADTAALVLAGDARLTDARTPTAHAVSHGSGGSDPVTVAPSQITGLAASLAAKADLVGGLVPTAQLPALAITETFTVASQSAMLALTAQRGDVAIRTDNSKTYILSSDSPSTLADWKEMSAIGSVASVNGQTGVIVLGASDVGAVATTRQVIAGTGLTGGGALNADVTLNVAYGTSAGTAAAGNDSRVTGALQKSTVTTKGDLLTATGSGTIVRHGVGADGQVLTADSAQADGVKWAAPAGGLPLSAVPRAGAFTQAGGIITTRSSKAAALNALYLWPAALLTPAVLAAINFETTSTVANVVARLGVYSSNASYLPDALVVDFGTVAAATTATISLAVSQALAANTLYWVAICFQTAVPNARHAAGWNPYVSSVTFPSGTGTGWNVAYVQTGVTGSLPATVGTIADTDAPLVGLKF